MSKVEMAKDIRLQMWKKIAIWGGKYNWNQVIDFKLTDQQVHKL